MGHQMILPGQQIHFLLPGGEIQSVNDRGRIISCHLHIQTVTGFRTAQFTDIPMKIPAGFDCRLFSADADGLLTEVLHLIHDQMGILPD